MAIFKMMQGDSYCIPIDLKQYGMLLTPDMIADLEVCVDTVLRKTYTGGGVGYDTLLKQWYIRPTQEETLGMEEKIYNVIARVKYRNQPQADVKGVPIGKIQILNTHSEEVI